MKSIGDNIIVKYEIGHNRNIKIGDVTIEISRECNIDLKEGNDQKGVVVGVSDGEQWLKEGDVVFTHYLSSDKGNMFEHDGEKYWRVPKRNVFFKVNQDGTLETNDGVYLCEQLVVEQPKTASGIYLTPFDVKEDTLRLKVTHKPRDAKGIDVGDVIMSSDAYQYVLKYNGLEVVKIDYNFISGIYSGEES
jgi:hypothetical protein